MTKDYSEEVKNLIEKYKKEDIEYHKPIRYLCQRSGLTKDEIEETIMFCRNLSFTELQKKQYETRYAMFFIYSEKKGKCFVLTLDKK